jgi:hypothetical protein
VCGGDPLEGEQLELRMDGIDRGVDSNELILYDFQCREMQAH